MTGAAAPVVDSRRSILQAAARLFRDRGYASTGLRDIAAEIGIKAASIYHHFPSKERIAVEVLNEGIEAVSRAVRAELARLPPEADPLDRLRAAMRAHLTALLDESVFTSTHIRIFGYVPDPVRAEAAAARREYDDLWRSLVMDVGRDGALKRDADHALLRYALLGAMNWSLEWYRADGRSPADIAETFFDWFADGAVVHGGAPGRSERRRGASHPAAGS